MRAEISFDLVMEDDGDFEEGTYRLPGGNWQVFIFTKPGSEVSEPHVEPSTWESGVTGVFVRYPRSEPLNREAVRRVLSETLGVRDWVEVRGPDSMKLR
jgi:hypothetical protein